MEFKPKKVLVFSKRTPYQLYVEEKKDPRLIELIEKKDVTVEKLTRVHREHEETLEEVKAILKETGTSFDFIAKREMKSSEGYDLVVAVGGDGTFLDASHYVFDAPLMGVNSSPKASVGLFCCAQKSNFRWKLRQLFAGELESVTVFRMHVWIDGVRVREPVLNDVLFASAVPSATSRYFLEVRGKQEEQKSSGVWISSAAGSTGAIRSAGGRRLSIGSRRVQYLVRELYTQRSQTFSLLGGVLAVDDKFVLRSKTMDGRIYVDGPSISYPVPTGVQLEIVGGRDPLRILGLTDYQREI